MEANTNDRSTSGMKRMVLLLLSVSAPFCFFLEFVHLKAIVEQMNATGFDLLVGTSFFFDPGIEVKLVAEPIMAFVFFLIVTICLCGLVFPSKRHYVFWGAVAELLLLFGFALKSQTNPSFGFEIEVVRFGLGFWLLVSVSLVIALMSAPSRIQKKLLDEAQRENPGSVVNINIITKINKE